ncbi:MAG: hypothetical protein U1E15_08135 [Hyphomicrobiales bacterium]
MQLVLNCTNMALSAALVLGAGKGPEGVGLAAVLAEYTAVSLGLLLAFTHNHLSAFGHAEPTFSTVPACWRSSSSTRHLDRTSCSSFAFGWFFAPRRAGEDDVTVAASTIGINARC